MRSRNIKPGFFKNELLSTLPPSSRLLFAGLWLMSDRKGRLRYSLRAIKGELFAFHRASIGKWLKCLEDAKFIEIYDTETHGKCIQIVNFKNHQHPHINEPESTIPAPYNSGESTVKIRPLIDSLLRKEERCNLKTDAPENGSAPPLGLGVAQGSLSEKEKRKQIEAQNYEERVRAKIKARLAAQ
jgi:hypothetical protein